MRRSARLATVGWLALGVAESLSAISLGSDPRLNAADFSITVFASGLSFPSSLAELPDGSILVATAVPGGSFFASPGQLLRFVDADGNGIADGPGSVQASGLPNALTSVRLAGDLVLVLGAGPGGRSISVLRRGAQASDAYTLEGTIALSFPANWSHTSYALAVHELDAQTHHIYFNVGSFDNANATSASASASGLVTGTLVGDSVYRFTLSDQGVGALQVSGLIRIAAGLRNAAGIARDESSGDLWLSENGIDSPQNLAEPFSADELNAVAASDLGGSAEDFGFPSGYVAYRTGTVVGGGIQPLIAFQPIPDPQSGAEAEGAVEIAFAPPLFPASLQGGVLVGFHGMFAQAGAANEENAVAFVDRANGGYFHFLPPGQTGVGHPNGLLATQDSLFIADFSSQGAISVAGSGSGVIHQLRAIGPDADTDGVLDVADNCPHAPNPTQADSGGIGATSGADGVGDACQCGDVTGDGRVSSSDAIVIARSLLVPPTAQQAMPQLCNVGGSASCSSADAVVVTRALLVPPTASIAQSCAPALP